MKNVVDEIKQLMRNRGVVVTGVNKLTKGTVNEVYKLTDIRGKMWVIKILKHKGWPKTEQIRLIEKWLSDARVEHIKLVNSGDNEFFGNGYLLFDFLEGEDADELLGKRLDYEKYYDSLGKILGKVHKVNLMKFGSLTDQNNMFETYPEFVEYKFNRDAVNLRDPEIRLLHERVCKGVLSWLTKWDRNNRPTLCHGDVSPKNIRIGKEGMVLIDWDNARAEVPEADIGVMRYWAYFRETKEIYDSGWRDFTKSYGRSGKSFDGGVKIHELIQGLALLSWYSKDQKDLGSLQKTLKRVSELKGVVL